MNLHYCTNCENYHKLQHFILHKNGKPKMCKRKHAANTAKWREEQKKKKLPNYSLDTMGAFDVHSLL